MIRRALFALLLPALLPMSALSESPRATQQTRPPVPGEEVRTETGKRMKVWSTQGPVQTNQAEISRSGNQAVGDIHVVVDPHRDGHDVRQSPATTDSFDMRKDSQGVTR